VIQPPPVALQGRVQQPPGEPNTLALPPIVSHDPPVVAHQVRQALIPRNDELAELQNSLRTFRLSNDGMSLLLERTQSELAAANVRIAFLEQTATNSTLEMTEAINNRLLAEGTAIDLNSQLLVSEFTRVHLQDVLNHSVATMSTQIIAENEAYLKELSNRDAELETLKVSLETAKNECHELSKQKQTVESELKHLHHLLQEKRTRESKQEEIRRVIEQELADVKSQLAITQSDLEDTCKKAQQSLDKLKLDLDVTSQDAYATQRLKANAEAQLEEIREELEKSEENRARIEKAKRTVDAELDAAKFCPDFKRAGYSWKCYPLGRKASQARHCISFL
jgi:chromosome segregation ATPase